MKKGGKKKDEYDHDIMTPTEKQDRVVELLTRGVLRLIVKSKKGAVPVTEKRAETP